MTMFLCRKLPKPISAMELDEPTLGPERVKVLFGSTQPELVEAANAEQAASVFAEMKNWNTDALVLVAELDWPDEFEVKAEVKRSYVSKEVVS